MNTLENADRDAAKKQQHSRVADPADDGNKQDFPEARRQIDDMRGIQPRSGDALTR